METEITQADLYEYAETVERNIKQYTQYKNAQEAISNFLNNVIEINRVQYLTTNGNWETLKYMFLITYGGPNIKLDTQGNIRVEWGGKNLNYIITDKEVLKFLRSVEDFLNQAFP
jgi:hypothetical protein